MGSKAYLVSGDGETRAMRAVACSNEREELQRVLEQNLDFLPGDQIQPDDPCQWLLVKREMPVNSPDTGKSQWSIDFFLADHNAMPTFVECKRLQDTRSRRGVVGQMLEYAANAQHYWDRATLRQYATQAASERGLSLEEAVQKLGPDVAESADDFFGAVENNLSEGKLRLIFFLEQAPLELRSIVDFLNRQMEQSEVLIVEARFFEDGGTRIAVPSLFGYTEQARRIKKPVVSPGGPGRRWNEADYFIDVAERLDQSWADAVRRLYDFALANDHSIRWGRGRVCGSYSIIVPWLHSKSILTVNSDGKLWLNVGWLEGDPKVKAFRDDFASSAAELLDLELPNDLHQRYLSVSAEIWASKVEEFIVMLENLLRKHKMDN